MSRVPMNLLFDDIEVIESVGDPSAVEVPGVAGAVCTPGVVGMS